MKKVFLAVLAIAAMMVSCKKEGLVDIQKETPEVEVNEPQPVILGSNLFNAPATKASVDNMASWKLDDQSIYVWALNNNSTVADKVFINNVATSLSEDSYAEDAMTGSLNLTDPANDNKPFYYGVSDADIYDFYAYYLGYNPVEGTASYSEGKITVTDVAVNGDNDIMIASTDKNKDAVVGGTMVNPKYLYSQYSARHGVTPNLVFNHMLSKFSFNVRYAGSLAENCKIDLDAITFVEAKNAGTLTLNGDTPGFVTSDATGDIAIDIDDFTLTSEYLPFGDLMVVPAGTENYSLKIDFTETFNVDEAGEHNENYSLERDITPADVIVDPEQHTTASAFEAGKHYVVNITVYGLEAVKVNVQLIRWEDAGIITIDPDQKEDGIMQQVEATVTISDESKACVLYAETFEPGKDIFCAIDSDFTPAPVGEYALTEASKTATGIASIKVEEAGKIASVVPAN